MPLARVVSFDGVSSERMAEMQREMEGGERPADVANEVRGAIGGARMRSRRRWATRRSPRGLGVGLLP